MSFNVMMSFAPSFSVGLCLAENYTAKYTTVCMTLNDNKDRH